ACVSFPQRKAPPEEGAQVLRRRCKVRHDQKRFVRSLERVDLPSVGGIQLIVAISVRLVVGEHDLDAARQLHSEIDLSAALQDAARLERPATKLRTSVSPPMGRVQLLEGAGTGGEALPISRRASA